jgi:hypothetical protein
LAPVPGFAEAIPNRNHFKKIGGPESPIRVSLAKSHGLLPQALPKKKEKKKSDGYISAMNFFLHSDFTH